MHPYRPINRPTHATVPLSQYYLAVHRIFLIRRFSTNYRNFSSCRKIPLSKKAGAALVISWSGILTWVRYLLFLVKFLGKFPERGKEHYNLKFSRHRGELSYYVHSQKVLGNLPSFCGSLGKGQDDRFELWCLLRLNYLEYKVFLRNTCV